ncbi:hypothetical protein AGMMS49959_18100 [Planctomycetales bacterium]|nr:PIN domain-containing protein [Planctomycetota bacterium]GHV23798.1 hypothetical protein AGMMS49959_18100 [Planctomycetales bacterium]
MNYETRKLRIYLETTIPNYLFEDKTNEKKLSKILDTWRLWGSIKQGLYDVVVSITVFDEIDKCPPAQKEKQAAMIRALAEIDYTLVEIDENTERLATRYIKAGGLKPSSKTDALHIAAASLANCDVVLSWNCSHITVFRAMKAVDAVNTDELLKPLKLLSPTNFLGEE